MNYMPYLMIIMSVMFITSQTGCRPKAMQDSKAEAKMDAPLRMKLREAGAAHSDAPVQCLVKLNGTFDEEKMKVLNETGITVLTVVKEIITIEAPPDALHEIATLDFVHSLSLSQTRTPQGEQ